MNQILDKGAASFVRRYGVEIGVIALLVIVGLAVRLMHLTNWSVWVDEWHTIQTAARARELPVTYPGYLTFQIYGISMAAQFGLWGLRLPSALFGVAGIAFMYLLGRRLGDRATALTVGVLALLSPYLFFFSLEARYYAMVFAWAAIGLVGASSYAVRRKIVPGAFALAAWLAVCLTHPASLGVAIGGGIWLALYGVCHAGHFIDRWRKMDWVRRGIALALLLVVLAVAAIGIRAFLPTFIRWMEMPLTEGVSFTWSFFAMHWTEMIISPASSLYRGAILSLALVLMAIGFVALWIRRPWINVLLLLQYLFTFLLLFLAHSHQEYTIKYSIALLPSQLLWIGLGLDTLSRLARWKAPRRWGLVLRPALLSVGLLSFWLLFRPDYHRITSRDIGPINEPLRAIDALAPEGRAAVFAVGPQVIQMSGLRRWGYSNFGLPGLDERFEYAPVFDFAHPGRLLLEMQYRAYRTGSAWLIGSQVEQDRRPRLPDLLEQNLELVDVYPSCLWLRWWGFLYRLKSAGSPVLSPYTTEMQLDTGTTKTLTCLNDGWWRIETDFPDYPAVELWVDGERRDPNAFFLPRGDRAILLQGSPTVGSIPIRLSAVGDLETYSLTLTPPEHQVGGLDLAIWSDGSAALMMPPGSSVGLPLEEGIERPAEGSLVLRGRAATSQRSHVAIRDRSSLLGIVVFDSEEEQEKEFPVQFRPGMDILTCRNVSPITHQQAENPASPQAGVILNALTLRHETTDADDRMLKQRLVLREGEGRMPFLLPDGSDVAWNLIGDVSPVFTMGRSQSELAVSFPLSEVRSQVRFLSMPAGLTGVKSLLLRVASKNDNPDSFGYAFRIYFLDDSLSLGSFRRVSYFPQPSDVGHSTGWNVLSLYDEIQPGERGIVFELLLWPRGDSTQGRFTMENVYITAIMDRAD